MSTAGDGLLARAAAALREIDGIGRVYDAPPLQAALPYALVSIDAENDWSSKSARGREVRLAVTVYDKGEQPVRLRNLVSRVESIVGGLSGDIDGWLLATMNYLRTRIVRERSGTWAGVVEFRARLTESG